MGKNVQQIEISCQVKEAVWADLANPIGIAERAVEAAVNVLPAVPFAPNQALELSLFFADDTVSHELNRQHRGQDKPTNVLSFPQPRPSAPIPWVLGDIVLAGETVAKEALKGKSNLSDHTIHLIMHGFLHLLGYDHQNDDDAAEMESLEISAMEGLGLRNPYEATNA